MVNRLLLLSAIRHLLRHAWQTLLSIIGIAIGVAVIIAVDLANQSAHQAFLLSAESLTGKATHQIVAGSGGIPESLYRDLRVEHGLQQSAPVIEGLIKKGTETLQLIGIDPLAEAPFRQLATGLASDASRRLLIEPNTALLSTITAQRLKITTNDSLATQIAGQPSELQIVGLLAGDNPAVLEGLVVVDISTAQELLDRAGVLDRIDLILDQTQADQLQQVLPTGLRLEIPATRTRVMSEMIAAFQTNLAAMSLLAMLVGAFLIYNTMTFSVLRRRRLLGTLRILGITQQSLFHLMLLEALLLALIGTALGLLAGTLTAYYLVQLVTRTINDLYFVLTVSQLILEPWVLVKGTLVGIGVTLLAAMAPAIEAARTVPVSALRRSQLESRIHSGLPWLAAAGIFIMLLGWYFIQWGGTSLITGFSGLFLIIAGYSLLIPLSVVGLNRLTSRLTRRRSSLLVRFALHSIESNLSRTGLSITALSIAVAATLGVSIMISSFRSTVSDWLDYTLRSDIYVSAISNRAQGAEGSLNPETRTIIQALPGIEATSTGRRVKIDTEHGPTQLLAIEMAPESRKGFRFVETPIPDLWPSYQEGEVVLISEPYAFKRGLSTADTLLLYTPKGPITLPIGGIFYDYGSDQGLISLSRASYARYWNDDSYSTIGVFLSPELDTTRGISAIYQALDGLEQELRIRSNREIREYSMAVFDRTFAITQVLRLLAIAVAFIGILSALMALQIERTREQAVLRSTGVTPRQLSQLTLLQTGLMGLYAGLFSLPLGWLMSEVLIEVINRHSFGWSIMTQLPSFALLQALLLAVSAAVLAGLYPAWRMRQIQPALALREE